MKNCIALFIILATCTSYSQRDWKLQESGIQNNLNSVHFVNENVGFIVGKQIILKTTDGGKKWFDVMRGDRSIPLAEMELFFLSRQAGLRCCYTC